METKTDPSEKMERIVGLGERKRDKKRDCQGLFLLSEMLADSVDIANSNIAPEANAL